MVSADSISERRANFAIYSKRNRVTDLAESRLQRAYELFEPEKPGLLLDIGCGDGRFGDLLRKRGWRVVGVDQVIGQLRSARNNRVSSVLADVGHHPLPFRSEIADAVFAGEIIEHLLDTDAFLADLGRILRPRGLLVLTTPNLASLENRLRLLFGKYPLWVDYRLSGEGHVRAYTPRVLRRQLIDHGFSVERITGNWIPVLPQAWIDDRRAPWLAATGRWVPGLAMDLIVAARRQPSATHQY